VLRDLPHRYGRRIPDGLLFGMRRVRPPEIDPFIQALERADAEHSLGATFDDFDRIIITFSGGKDSMATLLYLLEMGVPREQIELQHQEIDEPGVPFMDWPCTPAYCRLIARAFGIPIYFSGRVGGFLRELDRVDESQAPIYFESPGGKYIVGGEGPKNTRGMFPAATANLKFRWCSSQLKIEVGRAIFRHDPRFARGRFLYISGQRAEESISRAKQAPVEIDPTTTQHRYVLRWKPVFTWDEAKVWDIIERWRVRPHPGYRLGFSRLSCMTCIFADANQWATVRHMAPAFFDRVSRREAMAPRAIKALKRQKTTGGVIETYKALNKKLGKMTTRRRRIGGTKRVFYIDVPISEQADKGCSFLPKTPGTMALVKKALSVKYKEDLILGPRETWQLPLGAFKKQGGPS
jgi:3'-phosphoadenosine 5'-phosphosulfate sulfotransferase (PAPS reductase)/FAD synthetase